MKTKVQTAGLRSLKTRVQHAEARTEQAETRIEQAKTRTEAAETRAGLAETRTEAIKSRLEEAETRKEQAETRAAKIEGALQNELHKEAELREKIAARHGHQPPVKKAGKGNPLGQLTERQRKIVQLIAEGQNTKQIGHALKISPKTVEYHRLRLMKHLNIHEIPGLVRLAMQAGLVPPET